MDGDRCGVARDRAVHDVGVEARYTELGGGCEEFLVLFDGLLELGGITFLICERKKDTCAKSNRVLEEKS